MARAVRRALACRQPAVVPHLGIDETRFVKRHQSVSVVVDLDAARILHVADDRPAVSLAPFFAGLSEAQRTGSTAVAVDMFEPYRRTLRAHVPDAHRTIVFYTFPVMQHVLTAVDTVRKQEHRALAAAGTSPLTRTRYAWRKNPATFSAKAWRDFAALRNSTLPTARAWAMYGKSPPRTGGHLRGRRAHVLSPLVWLGDAIAPRVHEAGGPHTAGHLKNILTYLKHRITSAVTEGLNAKIQWIKTSARGYRDRGAFKIAISLHCGGLDVEPRGGGNPLQTRKSHIFLVAPGWFVFRIARACSFGFRYKAQHVFSGCATPLLLFFRRVLSCALLDHFCYASVCFIRACCYARSFHWRQAFSVPAFQRIDALRRVNR
jgi:transposase